MIYSFILSSPFGKGGVRGILRKNVLIMFIKSPLAPLFQRGVRKIPDPPLAEE
jgi:hypothetical protein